LTGLCAGFDEFGLRGRAGVLVCSNQNVERGE
jgi:hypothetical protein